MNKKVDKISKLDAARRQLREAICLFFERRDIIAVHTLSAAALQILHDLAKARGDKSFVKDNPMIRPEYKKEVLRKINEAENFFKHADSDPDKILEFRPEVTCFFLFDALDLYQKLTGKMFHEGKIYLVWFAASYPTLILGREFMDKLNTEFKGVDLNDFEFFRTLL
jgi:hypothetical protein